MSDVLFTKYNILQRFKDMGDTTYAPVVAAALVSGGSAVSGTNPLPVQPVQGAITNMALTAGVPLAIDLSTYSGAAINISGLSADTLKIETGMDIVSLNAATLLKYSGGSAVMQDATALTGAAGNGNWSVLGFQGELRFTRTGSADTLTVKIKGIN